MRAPVGDAVLGDPQAFLVPGSDGVVEAHALDEAAVAAAARIRDDDVVERALLGAAPGKPDHYHVCLVRFRREGPIKGWAAAKMKTVDFSLCGGARQISGRGAGGAGPASSS